MRESFDEWHVGVAVACYKIWNLRYANDTAVLRITKEELW